MKLGARNWLNLHAHYVQTPSIYSVAKHVLFPTLLHGIHLAHILITNDLPNIITNVKKTSWINNQKEVPKINQNISLFSFTLPG